MVALLLVSLLAVAANQPGTRDITVYIFTKTDPSGFTDVNQQQRTQAVEDLRAHLGKRRFTVTDTPTEADIQLEVVDEGTRETGTLTTTSTSIAPGVAVARTKKEQKPTVRVALRVATYELQIEGTAKRPAWAADAVARHVEKWAKENRARLAEQRGRAR